MINANIIFRGFDMLKRTLCVFLSSVILCFASLSFAATTIPLSAEEIDKLVIAFPKMSIAEKTALTKDFLDIRSARDFDTFEKKLSKADRKIFEDILIKVIEDE
ncbi:hypothetical protein LJB93_01990 [Desulfovibrio sp. OttesenSCG-928-F07]|nr:hypothetical protein [Desulfovibrio sp. OttesenSCG-928-F07]